MNMDKMPVTVHEPNSGPDIFGTNKLIPVRERTVKMRGKIGNSLMCMDSSETSRSFMHKSRKTPHALGNAPFKLRSKRRPEKFTSSTNMDPTSQANFEFHGEGFVGQPLLRLPAAFYKECLLVLEEAKSIRQRNFGIDAGAATSKPQLSRGLRKKKALLRPIRRRLDRGLDLHVEEDSITADGDSEGDDQCRELNQPPPSPQESNASTQGQPNGLSTAVNQCDVSKTDSTPGIGGNRRNNGAPEKSPCAACLRNRAQKSVSFEGSQKMEDRKGRHSGVLQGSDSQVLTRIFQEFWEASSLPILLLAIFFSLSSGVTELLLPFVNGNVLDQIILHLDNEAFDTSYIWSYSVYVGVFYLIRTGVWACELFFSELAYNEVVFHYRKKLMRHLLGQDATLFDEKNSGELLSCVQTSTNALQSVAKNGIKSFLRGTLMALGALTAMIMEDWRLAILTLAFHPVNMALTHFRGRMLADFSIVESYTNDLASASANEILCNIRVVQCNVAEQEEYVRYERTLEKVRQSMRLKLVMKTVFGVIQRSCIRLIDIIQLIMGWYLVAHARLSIGGFVSFASYSRKYRRGLQDALAFYMDVNSSIGATAKYFAVLDRKPIIDAALAPSGSSDTFRLVKTREAQNDDWTGMRSQILSCSGYVQSRLLAASGADHADGNCSGSSVLTSNSTMRDGGAVAFQNVCFSYRSRKEKRAIQDISFSLSPGKIVALVGASGGGKSSCVKLLTRMYDPDKGRILLNGTDIRAYHVRWWRGRIGVVSQDVVLFQRSIAENIAQGLCEFGQGHPKKFSGGMRKTVRAEVIHGTRSSISRDLMERITQAARVANIHDFICSLPAGYDTIVGERGVRLSGGQQQRLAIARAVVRDPQVLVLDEASSALDTSNEAIVQRRLMHEGTRRVRRALLVISHRLSTVKAADVIHVLEKGRIIESGTHDELSRKAEGTYSRLLRDGLTQEEFTPSL